MTATDWHKAIQDRAERFAWIKSIRAGDVLESGSGVLRVVRAVKHYGKSIAKTSVTFTIRSCSWTGRCYTVMNGSDLATCGYQPTGARNRVSSKFEREIQASIRANERTYTCCDVRGLP